MNTFIPHKFYSLLSTENSAGKTVNQFADQLVATNLEKGRGDTLSIGIIGAGNFAAFAADVFLTIKGIKIIAIADVNEMAGNKLAAELKATYYPDYMDLLADNSIDLVYIATPPFLHFEISKNALLAGKHVICEKPAALKTVDAVTLQALAKEFQLLYVVNLMQRYNPMYKMVQKIIQEKMMGNFLHGFFENYACDENLHEQHWFWDETKSGGIFIEHGVHFFDMFSGWLGTGKVINAVEQKRKSSYTTIYDRVQATVLYEAGTVNFYHGFDQPKILDRQEMRLLFERGEITLYEWVPVSMKLHGLFTNEQLKALQDLIGPCTIVKHPAETCGQKVKGRFTEIIFDEQVTIQYGSNTEKQHRYQQLLKDMLQDQWNWIKNNEHHRIIDDTNAVESVRMAEAAHAIAQLF